MNLSTTPDYAFRSRAEPHRIDDHVGDQLRQIESMVEPIVESAKVQAGVLAELEGLVCPLDHGLEIRQHGVDPSELRQFARLTLAHDDVGMRALRIDDRRKARQSVAQDIGARHQAGQRPRLDRGVGKARDRRHLRVQRSAICGQRDCGNEGHLVRRAASTHARPFTAEVGIVDLDIATQAVALVSLSHHAAYLLLQQPRGAVGDAELAHQRQRGQSGLGLTDKVKGEEPYAQRQLGAVKQRPGGERRLVQAGRALHQRAVRRRRGDPVALRAAAFRAAKARRPSGPLQGRGALLLAAVALDEFAHGHPGLELDSVDRHGIDSARQRSQITGSVAHQMSLLSFVTNQVLASAHGNESDIKLRDRVERNLLPQQRLEAQAAARNWKPKPVQPQ